MQGELGLFDNRALRRMFGPNGGGSDGRMEKIINFCTSFCSFGTNPDILELELKRLGYALDIRGI
jgi:hypothetical protein